MNLLMPSQARQQSSPIPREGEEESQGLCHRALSDSCSRSSGLQRWAAMCEMRSAFVVFFHEFSKIYHQKEGKEKGKYLLILAGGAGTWS